MLKFFISLLCCSFALAQSARDVLEKAPPQVDQALRARISKFYQAHVDGKFRSAEDMVAEDSKDTFYNAPKNKCLSFEILRIEYSQNFTRAKATIICEQYVMMPGFMDKPVRVPGASYWKIENDDWFFYVDQDALAITPFGKLKLGAQPSAPASRVDTLLANAPDVNAIWNQVKADKSAVRLNPQQPSSDQVTITNHMPGTISLSLTVPKVPGVEIKLDRTKLNAGEKATVTFRSEPIKEGGRPTFNVAVIVEPSNQVIPIQVSFSGS